MQFICVAFALLFIAGSALAAPVKLDTLTVGPTTYSNVTILGANATDLYFTHESGIGNVKLRYLNPALQKEFHFDPRKAADAERQRADDDARYQKNLALSAAAEARSRTPNTDSAPDSASTLADPLTEKSLLGKPAPPLTVSKWIGDRPALEGKYVLVSFWAPGSPASRKWIPDLNAIQKAFGDRLTVIGLCADSESAVTNLASPKIEFPCAIDSKSTLSTAAGVTSIPTVLLLDPKGIVRYLGHPAALSKAALEELLPKPADAPDTKQ